MGDRKIPRRRKTTILDRKVLRYREEIREKNSFDTIYFDIISTIRNVAKTFYRQFPDRSYADLVQQGMIHTHNEIIPKYNPDRASFKTIVTLSVKQKFIRMLKTLNAEKNRIGNAQKFSEIEDKLDINLKEEVVKKIGISILNDELTIRDMLRLFKQRLTKESWKLYRRIYRDPNIDFKKLAKKNKISQASLYRKCREIHLFLTMLIERENR